ncbi:tight adherence pilus pseudopilin TadF [Helicobacter sp. 11S02596-1]|uniref:tight adherence pilus pseudopilin TadF n=1 Tax=Helicobacter sp. 11S02596-1 TaxID=1476194 RepID=UPI000BCA5C61|nr:tight adherence pilus pseudopilin TadF [Helicobacter sp. 11S02596-1]PAF43629.1 hypothetical protein BJI48_05075 [Helicobacter sp. 11S02596-1]
MKKKNQNLKNNFLTAQKASVSIEASIIFGLLVILIALVGDVGGLLINRSKMDRLSYSLASILRERSLYPSPEISSDDVNQLEKIAKNLQKDAIARGAKLGLSVQVLHFDNTGSSPRVSKESNFDVGDIPCANPTPLADYANLSVRVGQSEYAKILRVNACMKAPNGFLSTKSLIEQALPAQSFSIVLVR